MQITTKFLILSVLFLSLTGFINKTKADAGPPSNQTTFYFQKDGQPFTNPVKFNIKCYGTSAIDNTDKLLEISDFSETCQAYGCKFDISNTFEVYRQITNYCDLEGNINNEKFTINNFLGKDLSGLNCHSLKDIYSSEVVSGKFLYFKITPAFEECRSNIYIEYYPSGNGKQTGDYICNKYLANLTPSPMEECIRYTHEIKDDGKCYIMPKEFPACGNEMYQKIKFCEKYLEDITNKIAKDKNGSAFGKICEVKINVPDTEASSSTSINPPEPRGIFNRIMNFFKCNFLKLFKKSC